MTLKKRIEQLEERRPHEPEFACGLTAGEAYIAILDRRDLTFEEDPAKPGFYRLIKMPPAPKRTGPAEDITPEEAYRRMCEGAAKRGTGPSTKTPQAV